MKILMLNVCLKELHHEFHTPLTGSLGMARLLIEENNLSAKHKEMLDTIIQCNEQLLDFIDSHILNRPIEEIKSDEKIMGQSALGLKPFDLPPIFNRRKV